MKILLMKQTLSYIMFEAQNNNIQAQELLLEFDSMNIEDREKYLVLTDKLKDEA